VVFAVLGTSLIVFITYDQVFPAIEDEEKDKEPNNLKNQTLGEEKQRGAEAILKA
jgi:hypothetical protein